MRRTDQRRAAVVVLYQADLTDRPLDELLNAAAAAPTDELVEGVARERPTTPFTRELVEGVEGDREQLDLLIERHATGWALDRIAPLERAILRVALFELLHRDDVPAEVAIDEAVETAKELCGVDTPGFVNGILGAAYREEVEAG